MIANSNMLKAKMFACLVKCSQHAASLLTYKKLHVTKTNRRQCTLRKILFCIPTHLLQLIIFYSFTRWYLWFCTEQKWRTTYIINLIQNEVYSQRDRCCHLKSKVSFFYIFNRRITDVFLTCSSENCANCGILQSGYPFTENVNS
jgi:hypothetical protein